MPIGTRKWAVGSLLVSLVGLLWVLASPAAG
jgi:hypothetical protein